MEIYINNQRAALKKGTSFEYVSENRLFTGSDAYSLTITFPLRDCHQNIAIFGHVNRADVKAKKVVFDCSIRDRSFSKFGSIVITEINEVEVKTQFLEGRSEQNFDSTLDKVYINELDLGTAPTTTPSAITPDNAWTPSYNQYKYVALPWVNDYSGNIQNKADFVTAPSDHYVWSSECKGLSWQPYLSYITKKICEAIGYDADFSAWEAKEEYRYLLICNCLPYSWYLPQFAHALPHWTVEEYFAKLAVFLGGEFDINHHTKQISFAFTADVLSAKQSVQLDKVIEEHSTEVRIEDTNCNYVGLKNYAYKDCEHNMWKFYSCDWFVKEWLWNVVRFRTMAELLTATRQFYKWTGSRYRNDGIDKIYYAEECDAYFIIRTMSRVVKHIRVSAGVIHIEFEYTCRLQPINLFGSRVADEEAQTEEIEFVPAWIDDTEDKIGRILFLSFSGYDDEKDEEGDDESKYPFRLTQPASIIEIGEKDKKAEFYDRIYIGWYDGASSDHNTLPRPEVDNVIISDDWSNFRYAHFSMRINTAASNTGINVQHQINPQQKTTFKFLSETIPDVRSLFLIKGKRYVCEKLTATFTDNGKSSLLKGIFYPILD